MTSASDIAFASALDLVELYRTQALSPVEAAEALLDRAEALQPKLNAFCVIDRDGALEAARAAERRWRDGAPLGPLDGVPVTIKDLVLMRGLSDPARLAHDRSGPRCRGRAGGGAAARGRAR